MIRVTAPARLHFGLLSLPGDAEAFWPDRHGQPALPVRRFGGVGLMVERPALQLRIEPATAWSAEGPLAERALTFARHFVQSLPAAPLAPHRLIVEAAPPEHSGLGSGTQLGLAVSRALAVAAGRPDLDAIELACRIGRGLRSALGVHGFVHGGFLVEAGKRFPERLAPLVVRLDFPEAWRIVIALSPGPSAMHGHGEQQAFQTLLGRGQVFNDAEARCRLVLLGMLPALAERDLPAFGEALYDFNLRSGEAFAAIQGGIYAGPRVAELVAFLRGQGVRGVGQSSWGPAVFAVVGDEDRATRLALQVQQQFALADRAVFVTRANSTGARVGERRA
jgi:beta-ribofuranosylaminobenzene 5'-phosphate synthase